MIFGISECGPDMRRIECLHSDMHEVGSVLAGIEENMKSLVVCLWLGKFNTQTYKLLPILARLARPIGI